jgi:hypothetical protein
MVLLQLYALGTHCLAPVRCGRFPSVIEHRALRIKADIVSLLVYSAAYPYHQLPCTARRH